MAAGRGFTSTPHITLMNDARITDGHRIKAILKRDAKIPKILLKAHSAFWGLLTKGVRHLWNNVQFDALQLTCTLQITSY